MSGIAAAVGAVALAALGLVVLLSWPESPRQATIDEWWFDTNLIAKRITAATNRTGFVIIERTITNHASTNSPP